jgi:hypothetical protein
MDRKRENSDSIAGSEFARGEFLRGNRMLHKTHMKSCLIGALAAAAAFAQPSYPPPNAGDLPNTYKAVLGWGQLPARTKWGATSGVSVGPDGNIWTYERCGGNSCFGSDVDPVFEARSKDRQGLETFRQRHVRESPWPIRR